MDIKLMIYHDHTFEMEQMQSTMRHLFLDDMSRNNRATGGIASRGVTLALETLFCIHCGKERHFDRNCWRRQDKTHNSDGDIGGDNDKKQKIKSSLGKKSHIQGRRS